ncbi:primosomal protein N' [Vicingaceae bacterium]|nr:primosomal protein N' [Vicingaceae bacterium]
MGKKQQDLFQVQPPQWQLDDEDDWIAARVALPDPPHGPFDYLVPIALTEKLKPGMRVRIPLGRGNRIVTGYCVKVVHSGSDLAVEINPAKLKPLEKVLDVQPLLTPPMIELAEWISEYYLCPLGTTIETVVPTSVRDKSGTREVKFLTIDVAHAETWRNQRLTEKQRAILEVLATARSPLTIGQLASTAGCTVGPIRLLRDRGMIKTTSQRVQQKTHEIKSEEKEFDLRLNSDQQKALDQIEAQIETDSYKTFLMHGITGSGKTEVYIRAIQRVIEFGRQAIVLVPEISLTPQTRQRFRARFENVAVLHSHMTSAERSWHWGQIADGRVQVVIGARSAIFAPTPNLGMIVIDEEHDASFKQDKAPRYHGRDVAIWRAKRAQCPLILGSATPSLESWQRVQPSKTFDQYELLNLPTRVLKRPLPEVATIDLRSEFANRKSRGAISRQMHTAMRQALEEDGQIILLLNRRGFATNIQCPACGHVVYCPDCAIPMTHHRDGKKAACHYCDHQIPEPKCCPECQFEAIRFSGLGTQKLEQEVQARFANVTCARMDTDTMQKPGSHEAALARFRSGETRILLGTQMIAKGLDFPNVTLVGVVNADTSLHFPDFRAAERTFALVTQVAGRSGRGPKGGRVLVQTFCPEHPAIVAATQHDYCQFASFELLQRAEYNYPPLAKMARMVVRGAEETPTELFAASLAERVEKSARELDAEIDILGPAAAPVEKLRGKFRFHFLLQSAFGVDIQGVVRRATNNIKPPEGVQWIVDIDPLDML